MINCKDFVPKQLQAHTKGMAEQLLALVYNQGEYQSLEETIAAANVWIKESAVRVLNVETVVLPNIWEEWEEGSRDPAIRTFEKPIWHQFIRVWYDDGK